MADPGRTGVAPAARPPLIAFTSQTQSSTLTTPDSVQNYIDWFGQRYGLYLENSAVGAWHRFSQDLYAHWAPQHTQHPPQPVVFYALARERWSLSQHRVACPTADVAQLGLDGRSHLYEPSDVTGFDFPVQARLVQQAVFPDIIRQVMIAMLSSWQRGLPVHYVFVCNHGTHRSVGTALVAAQVLCPSARIAVGTNRLHEAAVQAGFLPSHAGGCPLQDALLIPF